MFAEGRPAKKFNGSVIPTNKAVPLNGKHETNNLCALCGSAVNNYISFKI
jgi:RNA recognition motif-containing protein